MACESENQHGVRQKRIERQAVKKKKNRRRMARITRLKRHARMRHINSNATL